MTSPQADLVEDAYKGGKLGAEFVYRCQRSKPDHDALHDLVGNLVNAGNVPGLRAFLRRIQTEIENAA